MIRCSSDPLYILRIYCGDRTRLVYRAGFSSELRARIFFDGYKACAYRYLPSEDILLYSIEEVGRDWFVGTIDCKLGK